MLSRKNVFGIYYFFTSKFLIYGVYISAMRCELCGKEEKNLKRAIIEGAEMRVCAGCAVYGKILPEEKKPKPVVIHTKKYYGKDIFEKMNKEIVSDWGERIKKARERKGISREKLGAMVGEKTTAIAKIENQELRPSDETAKKLEKLLDIVLFQEVKSATIKKTKRKSLTIGDILGKDE